MRVKILILSKTKYGNLFCMGGVILNNNQLVRLTDRFGNYQPADTDLKIGNIIEGEIEQCNSLIPPHIENVILLNYEIVDKENDLKNFILNSGLDIYNGNVEGLFDGLLKWTFNGSGYYDNQEKAPKNSVGFLITDTDLVLFGKYYKITDNNKKISYVGCEPPIEILPKGTLLRVSLSKWFYPDMAPV